MGYFTYLLTCFKIYRYDGIYLDGILSADFSNTVLHYAELYVTRFEIKQAKILEFCRPFSTCLVFNN